MKECLYHCLLSGIISKATHSFCPCHTCFLNSTTFGAILKCRLVTFKDIMKDRQRVRITDYYNVYHGNITDSSDPTNIIEYEDRFGNIMKVHSVSNPLFTGLKPSRLYYIATGFGIVRMDKKSREITKECHKRLPYDSDTPCQVYDGWPIKVSQSINYGKEATGYLTDIIIDGLDKQ